MEKGEDDHLPSPRRFPHPHLDIFLGIFFSFFDIFDLKIEGKERKKEKEKKKERKEKEMNEMRKVFHPLPLPLLFIIHFPPSGRIVASSFDLFRFHFFDDFVKFSISKQKFWKCLSEE